MRKLFAIIGVVVVSSVGIVGTASHAGASGAGRSDENARRPMLVRQPTPQAVMAEHVAALNACDVDRLMAQYPTSVAILLPGGATVEGRTDVRGLFEFFCQPLAAGGLNGITFEALRIWTIGKTVNVQWVATAPFLAAPYYGADAYVTQRGLLESQVTTFDSTDLQFAP
jgi:hypothetical protein